VIGTAVGGIKTLLDGQRVLDERGPDRVGPFVLQNLIADTASGQIAISYGIRGHNLAIVSACATGGHALGEGAEAIRRGDAVAVVAGGTEAAIVPVVLAGFTNMRALSNGNDDPARASKPFDLRRQGFVMSEGAAVLVLEELEHARKRGATIYAELAGYALGCEAHHPTAPEPEGRPVAAVIAAALADAGLNIDAVDHINAHGTATPQNDAAEARAFRRVFGDRMARIPVTSLKSMVGHCLGAAGAVEAAALTLTVARSAIPPTIHHGETDPDCALDIVANCARQQRVRCGVSTSLAFGGNDSAVVIRALA
jgi:3-oxoacyl-[acyl-carrier-protein] synthase II